MYLLQRQNIIRRIDEYASGLYKHTLYACG